MLIGDLGGLTLAQIRAILDIRGELLALRHRPDRLDPAGCADETICAAIPSPPPDR